MLVLSRKVGEQVFIGDDVCVTVVAVQGEKIRLGFTAPREISIHRKEIYRRIHADQEPFPSNEWGIAASCSTN